MSSDHLVMSILLLCCEHIVKLHGVILCSQTFSDLLSCQLKLLSSTLPKERRIEINPAKWEQVTPSLEERNGPATDRPTEC